MRRAVARPVKQSLQDRLIASGYKVRPCSDCARPVVDVHREDGSKGQLDIRAPVFVMGVATTKSFVSPVAVRTTNAFVWHESICTRSKR